MSKSVIVLFAAMLFVGCSDKTPSSSPAAPTKAVASASAPQPVVKSLGTMKTDVAAWARMATEQIEKGKRLDHDSLGTLLNSAYWGYYLEEVYNQLNQRLQDIEKEKSLQKQSDRLRDQRIAEQSHRITILQLVVIVLSSLSLLFGAFALYSTRRLRKLQTRQSHLARTLNSRIEQEVARQLAEKKKEEVAAPEKPASSMLILTSPCAGGKEGALAKVQDVLKKKPRLSQLAEGAKQRHLSVPFSNQDDYHGWLGECIKELRTMPGEKWVVIDTGFNDVAQLAKFLQFLGSSQVKDWVVVRASTAPVFVSSSDGREVELD